MCRVTRGTFIGEPVLQGPMEALQFPDCLWVIGPSIDQLHAQLAEAAFEVDLHAMEATGEAQPVVRQHLGQQSIA